MNRFHRFILCMMILIPAYSFAQVWEWTPAMAITDSVTDNRNAIVIELDFNGAVDFYVFWEKSADPFSTQIYTMSYYTLENPIALTEGDYHHTNPVVIRPDWTYPLEMQDFFLFYLSDEDGDVDIYYKFHTDGAFSDPVQFVNTPGNEKHLRSNTSTGLTWEYEGAIKYAGLRKDGGGPYYFTDIITVDSIFCQNPILDVIGHGYFGEKYLAWEKVVNDSSKVMLSQWNEMLEEWMEPEMVYDSGHNTNLRFEESTFSEVPPTLAWDMTGAAGHRKIILYDPWYGDFLNIDANPINIYAPSVFNIFVGVKEIWFFAKMTFLLEENDQTDVYGGDQTIWPYSGFENLSSSSAIEMNPQLWNGNMYIYFQNVLNIWESYRNAHWQLWTSRIDVPIAGSITEEGNDPAESLQIFPNPFSDHFNVNYKADKAGSGQLILYDQNGRNLGLLSDVEIKEGDNTWEVNVKADLKKDIPSGLYYLKLVSKDKILSQKIIKVK